MERRRVVFSGRVQGVGFRMTAVRFAAAFRVSGTVRNLPDGDVELLVQGTSTEIEGLVERLCEHFDAAVRSVVQESAVESLAAGVRIVH